MRLTQKPKKNNMKLFKKKSQSDNSKTKLGEFTIKDYPKDTRNKEFYFHEYCKPDGEWINTNEPICKIRIGEKAGYMFKSGTVIASKAGFLEWTVEKDCLLKEKMVFYKLHEKGLYHNENSIDNHEFRHYFKYNGIKSSFERWLVTDGSFVQQGTEIYKYKDPNYNELTHNAERDGFIHIVDPGKTYSIFKDELLYFIRDEDNKRIKEKYRNLPNIINDDFTNSKRIIWGRVSTNNYLGYGIISRSDNALVDLLFTFNYLQNNDTIVLHFNPKQLKPKQKDKVSFLFEDDVIIEFELSSNPTSIKNRADEKVLEYKSLITKSELEIFANKNLKKWKIDLNNNNNQEILGGESGSVIDYESKNNLITVIKKFTTDYLTAVNQNIDNYQPTETREILEETKQEDESCFVYLMVDTTNGYFKIGISNNPNYREKTLQSEKPTIELMASKQFPVRKIAESIEKSLHDVYAEKRLRGEWFELDEQDVKHIIETLK